jgi:hypothetical protein
MTRAAFRNSLPFHKSRRAATGAHSAQSERPYDVRRLGLVLIGLLGARRTMASPVLTMRKVRKSPARAPITLRRGAGTRPRTKPLSIETLD